MIAVVVALLVLTAVAGVAAGVIARRRGPGAIAIAAAAAPVVLVIAAASVALAAPAAQGAALAAVRVTAVLAAMAGGSALVKAVFVLAGASGHDDPAAAALPADEPAGAADADCPDGPPPAPPLRGGLAIGVLERAAIVVCVLANFAAGLAVIVAAKGLARYPELRHPGAAEQFIIGTFVSVLWACACAGVAVALGR